MSPYQDRVLKGVRPENEVTQSIIHSHIVTSTIHEKGTPPLFEKGGKEKNDLFSNYVLEDVCSISGLVDLLPVSGLILLVSGSVQVSLSV